MLELTGEERTIPLSEDTEVVEISMGGRPEGKSHQKDKNLVFTESEQRFWRKKEPFRSVKVRFRRMRMAVLGYCIWE